MAPDFQSPAAAGRRLAGGRFVGIDERLLPRPGCLVGAVAALGEVPLAGAEAAAAGVSYTHLDVYKRQVLRCPLNFVPDLYVLNFYVVNPGVPPVS
ncbi:hypothetical protein B1A87_010645 [Arthrobacter sp. KBS0703]|nr:hypothetical protein B1A87_010645 [Arthrobacter sp. KBS0703]